MANITEEKQRDLYYDSVIMPFFKNAEAAGIPAALVAREIGISRQALYSIKSRDISPSVEVLGRISRLNAKITTCLSTNRLPIDGYNDQLIDILRGE